MGVLFKAAYNTWLLFCSVLMSTFRATSSEKSPAMYDMITSPYIFLHWGKGERVWLHQDDFGWVRGGGGGVSVFYRRMGLVVHGPSAVSACPVHFVFSYRVPDLSLEIILLHPHLMSFKWEDVNPQPKTDQLEL